MAQISIINLHQKAEIYLAQGKLEAAMTACHRVLEIESNFPATCKTLGNIWQRMGKTDQAKEWYIKAINQQPNLAEAHANLGSIYAQQKQWQLAIECCREAIGIKPNIPGFYRNLGKIWQQLGKVELARDCQEQALNLEAQYPQALEYLKQGKNCLENGEIEEAITYFQQAIRLNSSCVGAYQNLGDISLKIEDFNEAINYYQKAIELKPDWWVVHHKLGKVFQEIGELDSAISSFRLSIEINKKNPWSEKNLGDILFQKGELYEAEKSYQKVIELKSELWEVRRKLVEIKLQIGKLNEAIIDCIQVIAINPNLTWFNQQLEENISKLEQQDQVLNYYRYLVKTEPNNIKWLDGLGKLLVKLQEWDEAIIVYRRVIELEANNHLFHKKLADALQEKGLLEAAISSYQKAIDINPNLSWLYYNFGEALRKLQRWDEAIIVYHRAIELEAYQHLFHRRLADVFQEKGLLHEAISSYKTAIEINPKSCWHYAALGNAYIQQENFSEAIPCLIQALKMRPDYYDVHKKIEYILKKQGIYEAAKLWETQEKLPQKWISQFLNFTEDWEVTSDSPQTNITQINIYTNTEVNLLPTQTIDTNFYQCFRATKVNSGKAFVAIVPEGKGSVDLGTTAVISSDNKLVRDISTGCAEIILSSRELSPAHYIDGIVAFLSAKWGGNVYYHWMFDVVIRIDLLCRSGWTSKIDKFVFSKCDKKFHQETLEALKIPQEKIIESRFIPHIKAKKLVVPSFTIKQGGTRSPKWGCEFIRNLFLNSENIGQISDQSKGIFISRKLTSWRRVVNEDEVVSLLEKFGFISLTLESFSVTEQAALMSKVRAVIAPHGAGLTNLVFCSPGTKVIEIFSPNYINIIYWQISSLCHLSHYYLIGENFENDNSARQSWKPDILVDLKKLVKIMKLAKVI